MRTSDHPLPTDGAGPRVARLRRALADLEAQADGPADLRRLSRLAALSRFQFHRRFAALTGLSVARYDRLARLQRAAWRLAFRGDPVTTVALDGGYGGPEAFARAFRRTLGQSPSGFRRAPRWARVRTVFGPLEAARARHLAVRPDLAAVRIALLPPLRVAVLSHRGDPAGLEASIRRFVAWRRDTGLVPRVSRTFNILYGNPATTPPAAFRLDLCAALDRPGTPALAPGMTLETLPGGRCALLRHVGPEAGLGAAIDWLCRTWLPASGRSIDPARPLLCQRIAFFPDVAATEAVTEIRLPLL